MNPVIAYAIAYVVFVIAVAAIACPLADWLQQYFE
jgi:hypothetical protein